jgi:polyisoprenoid-binding protein YceI
MKRKGIALIAAGVIIVGAVTGYTLLDKSLGNNVEIESVIPKTEATAGEGTTNSTGETAGTKVTAEQLNGKWTIKDASKIYWSVTTSKETVNFVDNKVQGTWNVNVEDSASMAGEGTVDMNALDSGNSQRDEHVKGEDFLDVMKFPQSTFTVKSFSELPTEWAEGTSVPVELQGTLTVKGVEKEVTFQSQAVYSKGELMLSGTTTVAFSDFGLSNPHTVVLNTENELDVRLELILAK